MKKLFAGLFFCSLVLAPVAVFAASNDAPGGVFNDKPGGVQNTVKLSNPLGNIDSFNELISALLDAAFIIGLPIAVLFIVLSGARFVFARGNSGKLNEARTSFFYTVVGIGVFFGAWTLAKIIESTIRAIGIGS